MDEENALSSPLPLSSLLGNNWLPDVKHLEKYWLSLLSRPADDAIY
jgi:hypothetical protein